MDFHLRYRGPLPANGNPGDKATIRESLSPQIAELFATARQLKNVSLPSLRTATRMKAGGNPELAPAVAQGSFSSSIASAQTAPESDLFYRFSIGCYSFIPLITRLHGLVCEIDLTFLRREEPGAIVNAGGDMDNRLKTLFDALRIPHTTSEFSPPSGSIGSPVDVFCLLEDDVLITRLGLRTGRLLGPLDGASTSEKPTDVELHMHVFVKVNEGMIANLDFM